MKQTDFARTLTCYLSKFLPGERNVSTNTIKSYRDTFKQLLLYMSTECRIKPEYLSFNGFYNSRNHPFTRPGITYILKKYFNIAKKSNTNAVFTESINPHMLRHYGECFKMVRELILSCIWVIII
jgi:hypothetical protein